MTLMTEIHEKCDDRNYDQVRLLLDENYDSIGWNRKRKDFESTENRCKYWYVNTEVN